MAVSSTSWSKDNLPPTAWKLGESPNPAGRPRIWNIEEMADKLYAWSLKEDSFQLSEFAAVENIGIDRIYAWRDKSPVFAETLMNVRARIAARRSKFVNSPGYKLNDKDYAMHQGYYDWGLNEYRREEMKFEYSLKNDVATAPVQINLIEKPYRKKKDTKDE